MSDHLMCGHRCHGSRGGGASPSSRQLSLEDLLFLSNELLSLQFSLCHQLLLILLSVQLHSIQCTQTLLSLSLSLTLPPSLSFSLSL